MFSPEAGPCRKVPQILWWQVLDQYLGNVCELDLAPQDPTVGLCLGPYGDPRGGAVSYERRTPVSNWRWWWLWKPYHWSPFPPEAGLSRKGPYILWGQVLDQYFGNVCELDLVFNFHKVNTRLLVQQKVVQCIELLVQ